MNDDIALLEQRLKEQEDRLAKAKIEAGGWNSEVYFARQTIGLIKGELIVLRRAQKESDEANCL